MPLVAVVTMLALLEYFYFGLLVGQARARTGIEAPAISGNPEFERYMRVQQNTLEQLVIMLPSMWIFAMYVHEMLAAMLGGLFILARMLYQQAYVKNPSSRTPAVVMTGISQIVLMAGAAIGAAATWF